MTDFVMPKAGITMDEGTVVTWLVKPGESFKEGQPLAVVETDKASIEVNANEDGVILAILVDEGRTVPVGTPIARVGKSGEAGHRLRVSPLARRMAVSLGVDLHNVKGTGPGGRILRRDIEAAHGSEAVAATAAPAGAEAIPVPQAVHTAPQIASVPAGPGKRVPLTRIRRIIAERMTLSTATIPQFRVSLEVDVTRTVAVRESLVPLKVKLSFTDFLIQAVAQTLQEHPMVNASFVSGPTYAESAIQVHDQVNIGLAVALEDGLVVPVVTDAGTLSLVELTRVRAGLVEAAKIGKLTVSQLSGGTFTISNLGSFGIDSFDAIVNPPEAAILAVGQIVKRTVVTAEGSVEVRPMLSLTLTSDHRVLDGASAARFLRSLADRLQKADQYRLA